MLKATTIIEAIHYLLSKVGRSDKLKIVKLIYIADKYHLLSYGRIITNDNYFAMEHGPIGSMVLDILESNDLILDDSEIAYATSFIEMIKPYDYRVKSLECDNDTLSETDSEALDFAINKFGNMTGNALRRYTHKFPEWYQHKIALSSGIKRVPLKITELFSTLKDDPWGISIEHINQSREIFTGVF